MNPLATELEKNTICSVSGLSVLRKPEWTDVRFDTKYRGNISVLGNNIILSQSSGIVTLTGIKKALDLLGRIIAEVIPPDQVYIFMQNNSNLKGNTLNAYKYFRRDIRNRRRMAGYIAFNNPGWLYILMKIGIRVAKPRTEARIAEDYAQAVNYALEILSKNNIDAIGFAAKTTDKNKSIKTIPIKAANKAFGGNPAQKSVDELWQYIANIDWNIGGLNIEQPVDPSHPYFDLFEFMRRVKLELDELLIDRDKAEAELRQANDTLEIRVKKRTEELEKLNKKLETEINERKKIEEELKLSRRLAESASMAKSEFLANMSHELRTPLNQIIALTNLLANKECGELSTIQEEYLNDMRGSSRHLLSLINDLLDLSKVEAGKMELHYSAVDTKQIMKDSLSIIREHAKTKGIHLSLRVEDVPDIIIGDERKLRQILYNLLSNAVKFSPYGGRVRLSAQRKDRGVLSGPERKDSLRLRIVQNETRSDETTGRKRQRYIEFTVSDTGVGIRPEDQKRIFNRFEKAHNPCEENVPGTGLGLALSRKLVELHNGRIWVESAGEGKGATFRFAVPLQSSDRRDWENNDGE